MGAPTGNVDELIIRAFLQRLSEKYRRPATLYLLGGGALILLGNSRPTLDIDYFGSDLPDRSDELEAAIRLTALEMHIEVEGVPLDQFIPLPEGTESRRRLVGYFGTITAYVFDPYSIAISKLDRGFETDLQDIVFLIRSGNVLLETLMIYADEALKQANDFDIDPREFQQHLTALQKLIRQ